MPFSALIDALDDHLEARRDELAERLGAGQARRLATVFPALAAKMPAEPDGAEPGEGADQSGMVRYRLYRAIRQLIEELAAPAGLALILDDVHWADDSSAEFLDHLVRHPPRGNVLVTAAYRPAQVTPRLAALVMGAGARARQVTVGPLDQAEVEEFLGPRVNRTRGRALYEASGGNPFYLEALARMGRLEVSELPPDRARRAPGRAGRPVGRVVAGRPGRRGHRRRVRARAGRGHRAGATCRGARGIGRAGGPRHRPARRRGTLPVPPPSRPPGGVRVVGGGLAARRARAPGRPPGHLGRARHRPGAPLRTLRVLRRSAGDRHPGGGRPHGRRPGPGDLRPLVAQGARPDARGARHAGGATGVAHGAEPGPGCQRQADRGP